VAERVDAGGNPGLEDERHVVLIDDDDLFRESLEQNLRDAGFRVTGFADGPAALDAIAGAPEPTLVLLDWKMPAMNGIEVLRRLRGISKDLPVIFLTVLSEQIYEEAALLGGAVDFVEKSRSFAILLKRMELIIGGTKKAGSAPRGTGAKEPEVLRVGYLTLRPAAHRCTWRDNEVPLTISEFQIVHAMAVRADKNVAYREIYDLVRGEGFTAGQGPQGFRQNVRTFIKRIRQKFRDVDADFDGIVNYPGFGYRWRSDDG
jgi:two-component system response regulator ChvI